MIPLSLTLPHKLNVASSLLPKIHVHSYNNQDRRQNPVADFRAALFFYSHAGIAGKLREDGNP